MIPGFLSNRYPIIGPAKMSGLYPTTEMNFMFFFSLVILAVGTYSIRALYFAVLKEANISFALTGTAVGIISVVGYSPDIFAGPIMGYLLDNKYVYLLFFKLRLKIKRRFLLI